MSHYQPAPSFLENWDWTADPHKPSWQTLTKRAETLQIKVGSGGSFKDYVGRAKAILVDFDLGRFIEALESRSMIRAFLHAWSSENSLARETLRKETIEALSSSKAGISRLGTVALIHLHLTYFDDVEKWQKTLFSSMEKAVLQAVEAQPRNASIQDIVESVRISPELIVRKSAAQSASKIIVSGKHTLEGLLTDLKLIGFEARRYREILNHEVFLRRIETADPHGRNDFLAELSSDAVRKASRAEGGFFGLSLVEALITRPNKTPAPEWIDTILDIAGDPRMSHTAGWSTWWQPLHPEIRDTMIRWLSDQDLELFLRTIEEYGNRTNNEKLKRMYPDRQQFLRGLQHSGMVRETRLYMPESARSFVRRTLPPRMFQTISHLEGTPDQSVIFIDCGTFHIVEGSHDFKIWIYEGKPHERLVRRDRFSTHIGKLRQSLADEYEANGQHNRGVSHNGIWQYPALEFIRQTLNVDISPSSLMTKSSYLEMLSKKGMP